jgi:hypothetical protein
MGMKGEYLEWLELFGDAERRRCWLLLKALECSPLAQAIDLARAADEFLAGAHLERRIADMSIQPRPTAPSPHAHNEMTRPAAEEPRLLDRPVSQKRKGLALSPEHREQLLQRFAQGARNAELASEFGLSKQQVQGIRMGSARDVKLPSGVISLIKTNRRRRQPLTSPHPLRRSCVICASRMMRLFHRRAASSS